MGIELIYTGSSNNWDAHDNLKSYEGLAHHVDQPMRACLKELKSRGLLEITLEVWTTEYGRMPWIDQPDGHDHYNFVYSSWMAGGGVKPGIVNSLSDEYCDQVAESEVHVHDFHATILSCLASIILG